MNERFRTMTDEELGTAIIRLGPEIVWPATPHVGRAVCAAILEQRDAPSLVAPRLGLPSRRRTLLVIAAVVLTLAGAALAARLVIELGAVTVRVLPGAPAGLPTTVVTPDVLGREVTLGKAARAAGFTPLLPEALGPPDRVWVDEAAADPIEAALVRRVVTLWAPVAGLPAIDATDAGAILMQFEGDSEGAAKVLYAETNDFGGAVVDGRRAFWTSGEHEIVLVTGDEHHRALVTGNVLIWQDAGSTFRLETALPKPDAVGIAESMRRTADAR